MDNIEELKLLVWEKGLVDDKYPSTTVRKDACGAYILFDKFGDRSSLFGWEIDHIIPASRLRQLNLSEEQIDNPINLRPLNWKNNASKGADYPYYTANVTADENAATNIEINEGKVVNETVQQMLNDFYGLN